MICWIAGWPHNGSTICRQILKDSFEIPTFSRYLESELETLFPGGESFFNKADRAPIEFFDHVREHADTYFVKTHELPIDDMPTIFVYRDGRDAVTALSNFWKIPLNMAIAGIGCPFGTWSTYYHAWSPKTRPNTLMVKFEDMVHKPNEVAQAISKFIGMEQKHEYIDDFEEKRKQYPYLFKDRTGAWKRRLTGDNLELFWKCHGSVMEELGYE